MLTHLPFSVACVLATHLPHLRWDWRRPCHICAGTGSDTACGARICAFMRNDAAHSYLSHESSEDDADADDDDEDDE
jgi:hypothetical protein